MRVSLAVRVNEDLELDAGTCEELAGPDGPELLLRPPRITLFHQVLAYLRKKPDPIEVLRGSISEREGVAAVAVTLRWGSYLAVLLDSKKPVWSEVKSPSTSRISDEEMARINIETSAAVAEWVDLCRADRNQRLYFKLVDRAVSYLPLTKRKSKLRFSEFMALANPEIATKLIEACGGVHLERVRADAERSPSRLFANALTNHAWRNGPVEDIHAGSFRGYPLDQRRLTPGRARVDVVCQRAAGARDASVPAVLGRGATTPLVRAGGALRTGRDVPDHALSLDSDGVVTRGTPAGSELRTGGSKFGGRRLSRIVALLIRGHEAGTGECCNHRQRALRTAAEREDRLAGWSVCARFALR